MSIQLNAIKRSIDGRDDETLAIGSVDLDAALDWIDEIMAIASVVETIDTPSGQFDVIADFFLTPAGKGLYRFESDKSMPRCEYQFCGEATDVERLIDKFTAARLRREGNLTSAS